MTAGENDTVISVAGRSYADTFFAARHPRCALRFGAATHTGHVRPRNEDQYAVIQRNRRSEVLMTSLPQNACPRTEDDNWIAFVADGVGGAARGDVASRLAIQGVLELSGEATSWVMRVTDLDAQQMRQRVNAYAERLQQQFSDETVRNPRLAGMGTTLTIASLLPPDAIIVHIGDSRAYLWRDNHLAQLTRDQTLAQELIDAGANPAGVRSFRHLLTSSLSADPGVTRIDILHVDLKPGDRLMLCSDGLTDMVPDESISGALAVDDPQTACDELVTQALNAGGRDNITVVVAAIGDPREQSHQPAT